MNILLVIGIILLGVLLMAAIIVCFFFGIGFLFWIFDRPKKHKPLEIKTTGALLADLRKAEEGVVKNEKPKTSYLPPIKKEDLSSFEIVDIEDIN